MTHLPLPGYYPREMKIDSHKSLYMDIYSNIIHN